MTHTTRSQILRFTIALLVFALCATAGSGTVAWAQGPGGAEDQVPQVLPPTAAPKDAPDQSNLDPVSPEANGDSTPSSPEGNTEILSRSCTAADIDDFLRRYNSPLAGHGATFVSAGRTWNVDPRLIVAIAGAESSLGRNGSCATQRHNPFGWGGGWPDCWTFNTWDDAINRVTRGIRELYFDTWHLYTIHAIGQRYCGSGCQNWESNVRWYYATMGGNPDTDNLTFSACPGGGGPTITVNRVWTDDTNGNTRTSFRPGDPIRWVAMAGNQKINRSWGYSLWEFEVYGRASSANAANETPEGTEVPAEGQPELFGAREDRPKPVMEVGQNELPAELLEDLLKQIDQVLPEGNAQ